MKPCIRCKETKALDEFYAHPFMGDGHLNKCKDCCKEQARIRHYQKSRDPEWAEAERARHREKFYRLRDGWNESPARGENAARLAAKRAWPVVPAGMERHHWSYQREHWSDVILLTVGCHRALHHVMSYDELHKQFRTRKGHLMDTKAKHVRYMLAAFNERARYQEAA